MDFRTCDGGGGSTNVAQSDVPPTSISTAWETLKILTSAKVLADPGTEALNKPCTNIRVGKRQTHPSFL